MDTRVNRPSMLVSLSFERGIRLNFVGIDLVSRFIPIVQSLSVEPPEAIIKTNIIDLFYSVKVFKGRVLKDKYFGWERKKEPYKYYKYKYN